MSDKAILVDRKVVPIEDLFQWAAWFEDPRNRIVRQTFLCRRRKIWVSTVFLGLDHSFGMAQPAWFESMIFGSSLDQTQWRYGTWEEAERGHAELVHRARQARWTRNPTGNRARFRRETKRLLRRMNRLKSDPATDNGRKCGAGPAARGADRCRKCFG